MDSDTSEYEGDYEISEILVAAGAFFDTDDKLIYAAMNGDIATVRYLIHIGADLNPKYWAKNRTPLILATLSGYTEIVRCLIDADADLDAYTTDQCTALDVAYETENKAICNLLEYAGAESYRDVISRSK